MCRNTKYTDKRTIHGASNASINRVLALLRRAMNIAPKDGSIHAVSSFPMMLEDNVRSGFIEPEDFKKLLIRIPAYLRPLMIFFYTAGCRIGAATQITWEMVCKDGRSIMLAVNIVKNKTPITIPGTTTLTALLSKMFRKSGRPVFDVTNLRNEWDAATTAFGRPELLVHDLCRSGVRNLTDTGCRNGLPCALAVTRPAQCLTGTTSSPRSNCWMRWKRCNSTAPTSR